MSVPADLLLSALGGCDCGCADGFMGEADPAHDVPMTAEPGIAEAVPLTSEPPMTAPATLTSEPRALSEPALTSEPPTAAA